MTGHFELKNAANGRFFFNLKAGNGETILTSNVYPTKDAASAAIADAKTSAPIVAQYERKVGKSEKPYFLLKTAGGDVLGRSESYSSASAMENGIKSVMRNAADATVKDLTESELAHR